MGIFDSWYMECDSSGVWECGGLGVGPGVWAVTKETNSTLWGDETGEEGT